MKGVITKFTKDGYGFLLDENGEQRFFHGNELTDQPAFLKDKYSYIYSGQENERCKVVEFEPSQNAKGPVARKIFLTEEVFHDPATGGYAHVKVTGVRYDVESISRIVQGIKKGEGKPVFATGGGNGTYRVGYPETTRELLIDYIRTDTIGWGTIDMRKMVLHLNNRTNITESFVKKLAGQLTGKTVKLASIDSKWVWRDFSKLII
jgi:cold shock CspA family protein